MDHTKYTPSQARAQGILRNIAEGNASPFDMASLLRNGNIPEAELPKLPKNSKDWRQAQCLASLGQDVFNYALKLKLTKPIHLGYKQLSICLILAIIVIFQ